MNKQLIVYLRWPQPGKAKTRLGEEIGFAQSAGVYARIAFAYLNEIMAYEPIKDVQITLAIADSECMPFFTSAFPECIITSQAAGDLGRRIQSSFRTAFAQGADRVVLTGSDIPDLKPTILADAFDLLQRNPIVLGPAEDGGYYLVGMQSPGYNIFNEIEWSSSKVLQQTLSHIERLNVTSVFLPELYDLDTEADFCRWQGKRRL